MKKSIRKMMLTVMVMAQILSFTVPSLAETTTPTQTPTEGKSSPQNIVLLVDNANALVKGKKVNIDIDNSAIVPIIESGRTLVPARFISEALGATVTWSDENKQVTIATETKKAILTLNSKIMIVNNSQINLDVPVKSVNGRVLLPLRTIAENILDKKVAYYKGIIVISDTESIIDDNQYTRYIGIITGEAQQQSSAVAPPYDWVDPTTTPAEGTLYKLYDTPSRGVNTQGSYLVYLPTSYNTNTTKKYPVIYWLHGGFGYQKEVSKALPYFTAAIKAGKMPEVIIVAPQALPSGWYANSKDGARLVEDVLIKDLIPHIDATYRTVADASGRGIEGMSMGGFGALRLGLKFPEVFGATSAVGPSIRKTLSEEPAIRTEDTFFGDQAFYEATSPWGLAKSNSAAISAANPYIRVLGGTIDDLEPVIIEFDTLLTTLKINHEFAEAVGAGHDYTDILDKITIDPYAFWQTAFKNLSSN